MVVDLKEFLTQAPRITVPSQYNTPVLTDVNQELVFVYDLSAQGSRLQRGEVTRTLLAINKPEFTFPVVPLTEQHFYHFLGIKNATNPGVSVYKLQIQYPQFLFPQEERYSVNTGQMGNMLAMDNGSSSEAVRGGRPFKVFPEGILKVVRSGDLAAGDVVTFSFLREIVGGAARVDLVSNVVTASEN